MFLQKINSVWQNRWGKQIITLVLGFTFFWGLFHIYKLSPIRLLYNDTRSEPRGIYLLHAVNPHTFTLHDGALIDFKYICPLIDGQCKFFSEAPYKTGNQAIKKVGAVSGDTLNVVGKNVYMHTPDSTQWVLLGHRYTYIPDYTPRKRIFTYAEKDWHDYVIPKGYFYGMSQRVKDSFDSRYYGLDKDSQLVGPVTLLWHVNLNPIFNWINGEI